MEPFDGSQYRREVLAVLRERPVEDVEDLFWLASMSRDTESDAQIKARLRDVRGFLNKEKSRPRQASLANSVLQEWPRVEKALLDPAARRALRDRLGNTTEAAPRARKPAGGQKPRGKEARKRRQIAESLAELGRIRQDPDVGVDLFSFLGLAPTASRDLIAQRIERVSEINRRRRPDRERALVDDLIIHARDLLLNAPAEAYREGLVNDVRDQVVYALLAGDAAGATDALAAAREIGISDAAILDALAPLAREHEGALPVSAVGLAIWCSNCRTLELQGRPVCASCGTELMHPCPGCGSVVAFDLAACPSCGVSLDAAREAARGAKEAQRSEEEALERIDSLPALEQEALLVKLVAQNPGWKKAARRLRRLPPSPPTNLRLTRNDAEVRLSWSASRSSNVEQYVVVRVADGVERVLGHTGVLVWDDTPPDGEVTYRVTAVRANAVSEPTTAALVGGLRITGCDAGPPVRISWVSPRGLIPSLTRVEVRAEGRISRKLYASPDGYVDRHVGAGRTYTYVVTNQQDSADSHEVEVTVGAPIQAASQLVPSGAPASAPTRPARPATSVPAPPPPPPPPAPVPADPIPGVDGLAVERATDGSLHASFSWPRAVTEVQICWHPQRPPGDSADGNGRKVTKSRYEIDDGVSLADVPSGAHVAVFTARRDAAGQLRMSPSAGDGARRVAP